MPKGYENAEMRDSEYSPWQQSSHSSLRTEKPSTWQRGTVNQFQNRKDGVRDTMRNPIQVLLYGAVQYAENSGRKTQNERQCH